MKRTFKKAISVFLVVVMLLCAAPLNGFVGLDLPGLFDFKAEAAAPSNGDIFEFGLYPQTKITDQNVINSLSKCPKTWVSYGYFSGEDNNYGTMKQNVSMQYADFNWKGNRYRAVTFSNYRPKSTMQNPTYHQSYQDDNGYYADNVYYFRYDPLEWIVLDSDTGLCITRYSIDAQPFSNYLYWRDKDADAKVDTYNEIFNETGGITFANDYPSSFIRQWLNGDFFNTAFSIVDKLLINYSLIETVCPKDSLFNCQSVSDKIFILSNDEVYTYFSSNNERITRGTDYSKCQGLYVYTSSQSHWLTRTPWNNSEHYYVVDRLGFTAMDGVASACRGVRPAMRMNLSNVNIVAKENYNVLEKIENCDFYIEVKDTTGDKDIDGAEVTVYIGEEPVAITESENGIAYFTEDSYISKKYNESYLRKKATVSAHLKLNNGLELCSEKVLDNGEWVGENLGNIINGAGALKVDEPRWYVPPLKVMIDGLSVSACETALRKYSELFAQATNGHVIVNDFELFVVPTHYRFFTEKMVSDIAKANDVDICMVMNVSTGAWAGLDLDETDISIFKQSGSRDLINGGYGRSDRIIWCPINNSTCPEALCHESGHYLFGFLDEYASAIGAFGTTNGLWTIPKDKEYSLYYVYDKDKEGDDGYKIIDKDDEQYAAYWMNHRSDAAIPRPAYASNFEFGLMEIHYNSIEMSTAQMYNGVNAGDPYNCTIHYFYTQASCEEKLAYELEKMAGSTYGVDYTYAPQTQTASYSYAGGDNVSFTYDYKVQTNSIELNSTITETQSQWYDGLCDFNYVDSAWHITAKSEVNIAVKDIMNNVLNSVSLNEDNGYSFDLEAKDEKVFIITATAEIDGISYSNDYTLSTEQVKTGLNFNNEQNVLSLYGDTDSEYAVAYACNSDVISNGEYTSLLGEYTVFAEQPDNIYGGFSTSVQFNLPIDYSSMKWFYKTDGEWTALETSIGTAEHGEPTAGCSYVGDGTYCLMAKSSAESVYSTPTDVEVSTENVLYDNEVELTFSDTNENILHYNIYYGTETITAENCEEMNIYVADSTQATISLEDSETTYYFAVQAVGNDGGKSELSESVSCVGAIIDSNSDGLPDFWLNQYDLLLVIEDVTNVDNDEDGLTNLQEYANGTNPLSPDTDGDNVYDGMEIVYNLNPLELMSNGETDDYIVAYGTPDIAIDSSNFTISEDSVVCTIENNSDGKAMRTYVSLYNSSGEISDLCVVNIDANSKVDYVFSKEYLVDGMRIIIDEDKITRDSDYSNNEFVYSPATGISTMDSDLTLLKSANEQLEFVCTPADATDIFSWESDDESVLTVDNNGNIVCNSIGEATVTVTTSLGYSCSYDILVEPFKGAGLTDFDCQLINDDSQVQIIGYVGDETSIVIPQSIGNIDVVSLSEEAFLNQSNLSAVSIHSGVASIGENAFNGCSNLTDVYYDSSRYRFNQIDFGSNNDVLLNADIHCSIIPTTAKGTAVLDDISGLIYGLNAGVDSIGDYTNIELEGYHWEYTQAPNGFGTGTTALLTNGETVMDGYTVIIFGDVNGDGWYDGEDAFLVNLIAKGMLSKDDVGEAIWTAADCNHDGAIDEVDVDLLSGAGLKLNDVDQSKTVAELATNSDYIEYVMLIDQSAGMTPGITPDVDDSQEGTTDSNTAPEQPADEIDIEAILTNIFEFFKKLFTLVFSFVIK